MHPVDLDKLLDTLPAHGEPIKHDDSPFVWVEIYVQDSELWVYLIYYAGGDHCIDSSDRRRPLIGNLSFKSLFYRNELNLLRGMLKYNPNWKP